MRGLRKMRARDLDLLLHGEIEVADLVVEVDVVEAKRCEMRGDRRARRSARGSCRAGSIGA